MLEVILSAMLGAGYTREGKQISSTFSLSHPSTIFPSFENITSFNNISKL
jgi:hypothetical protein